MPQTIQLIILLNFINSYLNIGKKKPLLTKVFEPNI